MDKFVNEFWADNIIDPKKHNTIAKIGAHSALARPIGYIGFWHRVKCAWLVFTGRADIVKWYKQ